MFLVILRRVSTMEKLGHWSVGTLRELSSEQFNLMLPNLTHFPNNLPSLFDFPHCPFPFLYFYPNLATSPVFGDKKETKLIYFIWWLQSIYSISWILIIVYVYIIFTTGYCMYINHLSLSEMNYFNSSLTHMIYVVIDKQYTW